MKSIEHALGVGINFFGQRKNIVMIKAITDVSGNVIVGVAEDLHKIASQIERAKLGEAKTMILHTILPRTIAAFEGGQRHIKDLRDRYYGEEDE